MGKVSTSNTDALTDEEKRAGIYSLENPTKPSLVNSNTPLDKLNLNWSERDLPEKYRTKHVHRLHPYLGKFIPQLVEIFLRKYFSPNQTILDPFCGSGTALVQANELGINAIGYDISAFNVLLSKVKTNRYDVSKVKHEVLDILEKVRTATQDPPENQPRLWNIQPSLKSLSAEDNEYLLSWFAPNALSELLVYRHYIETEDYEYKDLLKIILSRSARSARLVKHFDLDFPKAPQTAPYKCYKHSRICTPTKEAYKFLYRYSMDTINRIKEYSLIRTDAFVKIHHENSRTAHFPIIDGVITSPPYVGLIDYHEQHVYAYHLLGLEDKREHEIGAAANGGNFEARIEYKDALVDVFRNAATKMRSGGRMIVIAGDKHKLYEDIASLSGLEVEEVVKRHVNRRTGRRTTEYYESVFIWRKP
jgi:DNA modification methylase